jgi:8-oxo-dGTP pyrophosphatase MutT (NUDIX family)
MPAGLVDPGEDPAEAALRECLEETGYRARNAISLGVVYPNPALFANRLYAYLAKDVVPERAIANVGAEETEVVLVPTRELPKLILDGTIDHALAVATFWRYLHEHARL